MTAPTVTVYTAGPACQACTMTKRHLDRIGVPYTEIAINANAKALDIIKTLDFNTAPVVCVTVDGVESWFDGYRPDRLDALRGAA